MAFFPSDFGGKILDVHSPAYFALRIILIMHDERNLLTSSLAVFFLFLRFFVWYVQKLFSDTCPQIPPKS